MLSQIVSLNNYKQTSSASLTHHESEYLLFYMWLAYRSHLLDPSLIKEGEFINHILKKEFA